MNGKDDGLVSWRELIHDELKNYPGETVIAISPEGVNLDKRFDNGYGGPEGACFTAWTQNRVVFPCCYDGSEWAESLPRNPSEEVTTHIGGY